MQPIMDFMRANWGWLLSFFTVVGGLILFIVRQIVALEKGVQALLRAKMIDDYNHYQEKGYAPIYARENFENCWKRYHALGANGVMDDIHNKFMALRTKEG